MFDFRLSFSSYKKANSYHPPRTDEGSDRKEHALSKVTRRWMERAALEPRPTSSMPVTVPSASLPISWVRAREQESVLLLFTLALHKMLCSGIFSLPFFFVFKIWTTDLPNCQGCSLAPASLCVHQKVPLEHPVFHWNTFSQLVEERGLCPAWTLTQTLLKPAVFSVQPKTPNSAGGRFSLFNKLHLPTSGRKQKSLEVSWVYKGKEQTVHLKFPRR